MKAALAWLALASLAAAAPSPAVAVMRLPQLPPSLLWDAGMPAPPAAGSRPVCEQKPIVARAALPDPRAYFMSFETFRSEGMTVHVAGSKDRRQKYGYFLAFTVEGDPQPVWVKMGLGRKNFELHGRAYSVETHLSLLHHERIRLTVRRGDGAVVSDFTVGELAERVQQTGPELRLLGREYRATYVADIAESGGETRIESQEHTVLLTTYDTYRYDGNQTGYHFSQIPLQAEPLRACIQPRDMGAKTRGPRGDVPVVYGFHVTRRNELQVYDLTDYNKDGLPPCAPAE